MTFQQLYYTSCERGLSGYAGYQFNAVTPGTSAETKRQVESLTGYEAPQSLAYAEGADNLAKCPVNLCYVPGPTPIALNVQYVGRDASRRFGNFFAHALAADSDAEFADLLPIELWRAPFWVAEQAPSADLPELAGPLARGWLSRAEADRFVAAHPHRDQVAAVLSAVGSACTNGDRPVLVVEDAADDVARWFAVISYLLPPRFVKKLSFATYLSRPSRSRLHLLGTISETSLDLGSDATENFCLFDFPGGRFSPVTEHPLAQLAARFQLPVAPALWGWVEAHASGAERSLDDWYPVAVAAAALGQVELSAIDIAAAASWLDSASYLPAARLNEIAWALHDSPARETAQLAQLRDVAKHNGDQVLYEQAECELLEVAMHSAMSAATAATSQPPVTETAIRDRIGARCQEVLQQTGSGPEAIRLLGWAAQAKLELNAEVVIRSVLSIIGAWLAQDVPGRRFPELVGQQARELARQSRQCRNGLVVFMTGLRENSPNQLPAVLAGLVGDLITSQDLLGHPELFELHLIYQARNPPVDTLARIAVHRGKQPVDLSLLTRIWPSRQWTRGEALAVLDNLGPRQPYGDGVADWFFRAAESDLPIEDIELHARLCDRLSASQVGKRLTPRQRDRLRAAADLHKAAAGAKTLAAGLPAIIAYARLDSGPVRTLMRSRVASALAKVNIRGDVPGLIRVLEQVDVTVLHAYVVKLRTELAPFPMSRALLMPGMTPVSANLAGHLAALWLFAYADLPPLIDEPLHDVFDLVGRSWQRKQLLDIARLIETVNPGAAQVYRTGVDELKVGRARRAARSVTSKVTGKLGGKQAPADSAPDATEPAGGQAQDQQD